MRISSISETPASPLGMAALPDQDPACVLRAFTAGINFFFFYQTGYPEYLTALHELAQTQRDQMILATGSEARTVQELQSVRRELLAAVGAVTLDIFFAEYINPADDSENVFGPGGVLDELASWKAEGSIRYVGASAHDRPLARQLARDPRVDVVMHRYNMAHRKAADNVFPAAMESNTPIVAFTATRWATLLQPHPGWPTAPPTAADCYRYCLAHEAVDIVLTAPKSLAELEENLGVLTSPRMSAKTWERWNQFGDLVYESGSGAAHDFESKWP